MESQLSVSNLTAKQAAEICGVPHRCLVRKLETEGQTIYTLLEKMNRNLSTKALASKEVAISDIGASVGFTDPAGFSRSFKRWTCLSPRAYRNHVRDETGPIAL